MAKQKFIIRDCGHTIARPTGKKELYDTAFRLSLKDRAAVDFTDRATIRDLIREIEGLGYKIEKADRD